MIQLPSYHSSEITIANHVRRYRSLVESGQEIRLVSLVDTYRQMQPLLHRRLLTDQVDIDVFNYAATRLPPSVFKLKHIYLASSLADFTEHGLKIEKWTQINAPNRRRLVYQDPTETIIACIINSESDIDDLINCLLAYHLEHQKIGRLLNRRQPDFLQKPDPAWLNLTPKELATLQSIFSDHWSEFISSTLFEVNPSIVFINNQPENFITNCHQWWQDIAAKSLIVGFDQVPVYFVSSNSHSLVNIIGGYLNQKQNYIFDYVNQNFPEIYQQWFESKRQNNQEQVNDFLYYLAGKFLASNQQFAEEKSQYESNLGIKTLNGSSYYPTGVQIIPLKTIATSPALDSNLKLASPEAIRQSKAYIVNIEYPLGLAARYLLDEILDFFTNLKAVYIIGKAAILNGKIGDIQIPKTVLDENSNNVFAFNNVFNQFFPFDSHISTVMKHQKAICVYGTFLENQNQMKSYTASGFNIIEMESGHYLASILKKYYLQPGEAIPESNVFNLNHHPLDLGIINYASDNPLVENLTQESLTVRSLESTYLPSLTVLQRIIDLESGTVS